MLTFWNIHECNYFMSDGAPIHKSKAVNEFLGDSSISVLEWPGNNPIKNT